MRVLVTGGSGFIGTNLVELLLRSGEAEFVNLDLRPPQNKAHTPFWRECGVMDKSRLVDHVKDFAPTHVVHLAATTGVRSQRLDSYAANTEGTKNLVEALGSTPTVERAVFTSSTLVCRIGYVPRHDTDYCPTTAYGQSKVEMEQIIRSERDLSYGWTIVRPVSIWGPWFGAPYKNLFKAIAQGWYFYVGQGHYLKSLGYVGNTVHQIHSLLLAPKEKVDRKTMYLADAPPADLNDFCNGIQKALGARKIRHLPVRVVKLMAKAGDILAALGWHGVPMTSFRLNNILTEYVYDVQPVMEFAAPLPYDVATGIEATVEWMRQVGEIS